MISMCTAVWHVKRYNGIQAETRPRLMVCVINLATTQIS
jgi:hypothetical protein